jgi:DNA-binding transcriptional ArsR family regulator
MASDSLRSDRSAPVDDALGALSDSTRRLVVSVVADEDAVAVDDLASAVAALDPSDPDPRDVALRLHHVHLPRLVDAGAVVVDDDTVTLGPDGRLTVSLLSAIEDAAGDGVVVPT